jgi:hypothetical protein
LVRSTVFLTVVLTTFGVSPIPVPIDRIERRRVLGALTNEYYGVAA